MYRMGGAILKAGRKTLTSTQGWGRAACVLNSHPPKIDSGEGRLPEKCFSPICMVGNHLVVKERKR